MYTICIGINYASGESKNLDEFTGSISDIGMHLVMVMSEETKAINFVSSITVNVPEVVSAK